MKGNVIKKENSAEISIGLLKGVIGAIPFIGTFVNEVLFDIKGQIYQKRINSIVNEISEKMKNINEEIIDKSYLRSDDFFDLTRDIFESSLKIESEEKRVMLANLYINSIENSIDFSKNRNKLFISFVVALTPYQITILKFIKEHDQKLIEIGTYKVFFELFQESFNNLISDKYEFKYYCNDLEIKGLTTFGGGLEDYEDKSERYVTSSHKKASVSLTSLGESFLSFLVAK